MRALSRSVATHDRRASPARVDAISPSRYIRPMDEIGAPEAKARLSELLRRVEAGEEGERRGTSDAGMPSVHGRAARHGPKAGPFR